MNIQQVLPYFQLAGQMALIAGALFAGYQLWQLERSRKDQADLQTVTQFNSHEFRDAFARIYELPLAASADDVRKAGPAVEAAATTVMMTFEMLGVLVYNRKVSLHTLDQAIGGFLRESWRRLADYVSYKRKTVGSARYGEWYQWLYERAIVAQRRERPAYEAFQDWKP